MAQNGVCGQQDRTLRKWRTDDAAVFDDVCSLPQECRFNSGVRMAGRQIR